jgi:hypothetical protein
MTYRQLHRAIQTANRLQSEYERLCSYYRYPINNSEDDRLKALIEHVDDQLDEEINFEEL